MFRQSYLKLLSSVLAAISAIQLAVALPQSYYTGNSLLSSGKWVKVKVTTTGMQEIPFESLRAMGFSDPSKVAVYGYSGIDLRGNEFSTSMPDDLPAVPVANYGDKLVFYGAASEMPIEYVTGTMGSTSQRYKTQLLRNLSNDCAYYFLTDSQPRLEVEVSQAEADPSRTPVSKAHGLVWKNFTDRHPFGLGAYLFGQNIAEAEGTTATYRVNLPEYDPSAAEAPSMSFGVAVKAAAGRVKMSVDGAPVRTVSVQGYGNDPGHLAFRYTANTSYFDGMSKMEDDMYEVLVDPRTSTAPLTEAALDFYAFSYPRTTTVSSDRQDFLSFPLLQAGQAVKIGNASATTKVWDVTPGGMPRQLTMTSVGDDGALGFVADKRAYMTNNTPGLQTIVFDPASELCEVEVVGDVAPQNYHGMDVPEMLVVASDKTYEAALELAALHREKTGVDVAVVPFRQICNEFASGLPHPMGIRRMVKMLYDRDPQKLKALLLFGRAFNDNTGLTSTESPEEFAATYVPMHQCDNTSECGEQPKAYATDAIYAMLSDDFIYDYQIKLGHFLRSPLDIKVGRIPASNDGEAQAYLLKARKYLDTPSNAPAYNRMIMSADAGDENLHLNQSTGIRNLMATIAPEVVVDMHVMSAYYPSETVFESIRRRTRQQLQRGVAVWFFLGHSYTCTVIGGGLWSNAYDRELINNNPPFVVYGTCQSLVMDAPGASIQGDMILNSTGGMIAGVGSVRPVYAQDNGYVCDMMARGYYSQKPGATFGDVYRDGRNLYVTSPNTIQQGLEGHNRVAVNTMCFNFAGDPMMPMRIPQDIVKMTSFNSVEADGTEITVNPLEKHRIEGVILNEEGHIDTSFSGQLTMTVYDGRHTVSTAVNADASNPAMDVDIDEGILQEVKLSVVDGRFDDEVAFAVPTYSGKGNRLSFYAVSEDLNKSATGYFSGLNIGQEVPEGIQAEAPVISSIYVVSEDVTSNACLPGEFTLYAKVDAGETPLLGSSDRMGGSASIVVDGSRRLAGVDGYLAVNPDGSADMAYPVTGLADGPHTLTFKVVNLAGLSAERSVDVNVVNVASATTVVETELARAEAVIDIEHKLGDAPEGRLVITDASGRTVFSKENVAFPYVWNLTATDGTDVPDGVYSASVFFKAGRRHGFAAPARIVVGR